jgi:hypothetical protein
LLNFRSLRQLSTDPTRARLEAVSNVHLTHPVFRMGI